MTFAASLYSSICLFVDGFRLDSHCVLFASCFLHVSRSFSAITSQFVIDSVDQTSSVPVYGAFSTGQFTVHSRLECTPDSGECTADSHRRSVTNHVGEQLAG